jgi:nucleotide-binding universal stress UspA family protein
LLQVLLPHTTMAVDLPVPIIEETFREARLEAERYLQDTADIIVAKGGRAQVTVRSGDPATEIVNAAHDLGADLVAMATHGRSGIRRVLFGSVAEGVLRRAPVPLLLVHGRTPDAARHAA